MVIIEALVCGLRNHSLGRVTGVAAVMEMAAEEVKVMNGENKKTILLVEDEAIIAMAEKMTLEKYGYKVITAFTGEEAVALVEKTPAIDLILMDINLGAGIDGTEAAEIILQDRDIPIVFLSSHTEPEFVSRTEKITAYGFIVKNSCDTVFQALIKMVFKLFESKSREKKKESRYDVAFEALRASEERYRAVFDSAPVAILLTVPDGRILTANSAACQLFEMTEEEIKGRGRSGILDVSDPRLPLALAERERTGKFNGELTLIRKNGSRFVGAVATSVFKDKDGNPLTSMIIKDITEKQRVEQALRQSEARAQALLNAIPDMLFRVDRHGVFLDFRADARELYTQPETPIIGAKYRDVLPAGLSDLIDRKSRAALETGALQTFEYQLPVPGRGIRDYEARMVASGADEVTAIIRDITENKRAEQVLAESEERFRNILFSMADWVWEVNENGIYTFSSEKGEILLGSARENIIGKTPFDFMPVEEAARVAPIFAEIMARKGIIRDLENWNIGRDGKRICLLTNGVPILDEQGNLKGYRGVDKDITERKLNEAAIRDSEEKYRLLVENINDVIFAIDTNGQFTYLSPVIEQISGFKPGDIIGKNFSEFVHPDDLPVLIEKFKQTMAGAREAFEFRVFNGKQIRHVRTSSLRIVNKGVAVGLSGIMSDITERKRAEEEIGRQLLEKEILLKEVHHRIKNNIASIGGLITMRLQAITNPEAVAVLQDTIGRIDSMRLLYEKLLHSGDFKDASVKNYIESLAAAVVSLFPGNVAVRLETLVDDFKLDPKRLFPLGIIINELLTNVMKYAFIKKKSGRITLSLVKENNQVTLVIQDNGVGLAENVAGSEAHGFGLALVKMLSQQLGGNFSIEKNKGTRCKVEFTL